MTNSKPVPPTLPWCPTGPRAFPDAWHNVGLIFAGGDFLAVVDSAARRVGLELGMVEAWGRAMALYAAAAQVTAQLLAQTQRPTEASGRGVRCHAHVMGLPVVGGAR